MVERRPEEASVGGSIPSLGTSLTFDLVINTRMRYLELFETDQLRIAYHGSPHEFDGFKTNDVFLANDPNESRRYGNYLYKVTFKGVPKFETPTIMVISPDQVVDMEVIDYNPDQVIYRT